MDATTEPTERQSAGATGASHHVLQRFDERWRALNDLQPGDKRRPVEDLQRPNPKQESAEDLEGILTEISNRLDYGTSERKAIYDRLLAIEHQTKRRRSRGFARFLLTVGIGVAATLAWQSYGQATKWIIATKAPQLGWSPETKQMIASWVQQFSWTKPTPESESAVVQSLPKSSQTAPLAQTAPATATPSAPIAHAIDPEQVHQIAVDLSTLQRTVEQIGGGQDQMRREIDRLQGAVAEILIKIPEPPPVPAASARKPKPVAAPSPPAPLPPQLPPHP